MTGIPIVLVPGAGGAGWYWHLVEADLRAQGFDAFAVDLPTGDDARGLAEYADTVAEAIGGRGPVVIAAQSLGGFVAPLVARRVPTRMIVLVSAMVPLPGETPGEWSDAVGSTQARLDAAARGGWSPEFDDSFFTHDLPEDLARAMTLHDGPQSEAVFAQPCAFDAWPDVPVHAITGCDDRIFPIDLQRRVTRERLGIEPDVVAGGHLATLSHPGEIAALIASYLAR
ncbi:alpha/beta fold hydrolase [Cellulomonas edaphi]|uniref:Alpha/beta hydrolase n=1 Tax=Cellulomonas edaphi TaxID=3053468 RepID=A0ABT7SA83_9CELL|nr:alpha/beta hydrolase [Cellulomons edaphi]MDM7832523.1 alpha/beta hydrolase [Cellulomons edaphi]